jgi:hypothetical protein
MKHFELFDPQAEGGPRELTDPSGNRVIISPTA